MTRPTHNCPNDRVLTVHGSTKGTVELCVAPHRSPTRGTLYTYMYISVPLQEEPYICTYMYIYIEINECEV